MKICVFCSANDSMTGKYGALAEAFGKWAACEGHTIVYGGCNTGLMECVAAAAKRHGGHTIGVVPTMVEERGRLSDCVDVHIPCDNLSDRKALMMAQSDVFVALPGGIGTLDEVFSVVASATIGYHQKTTYLLGNDNFWDPLIRLLDSFQAQGMMRQPWNRYLKPFVWKEGE
ncbi:MAG: TIGR00730 family Rossman fold protein [Prevotella sp.]